MGIKLNYNIFNWQKCPQEHPPFIYLLLAHRAEFTSPLDLSACPAEKVYRRTLTYYTSMCPDCRLLGRTWLDQSKTHQLEDVLTGFCPKSSVLSTLAPRLIKVSQAACIPAIAARCRGVCFFCKAFILDFIVSYHLLLFYRCKVEGSLLLLQTIFVLDIWGGRRFFCMLSLPSWRYLGQNHQYWMLS